VADTGPRSQRYQQGFPSERQIETGKQPLESKSCRHQRNRQQPRQTAATDVKG
jgi:hypothetical protein